jgi:hypothetical protein
MSYCWDKDWDEEPYGDPDLGRRRRWRRPWNVYLCYMVGAFGLFMTGGALAVWSPPRDRGRHSHRRHRPPWLSS